MTKSYRVTFFRNSIDKSGSPFRSSLETIRIARCTDRRQAFQEAVGRFEHDWSLYEWRTLADECEVVEDAEKPAAPPA